MEVYSWENYQFLRAMASMAMWNYRKVICQVVFAALLKWVYRGFPSMGNPENSCLVYGLEHPKQKNMNDVQMISGYSFKQRKARFGLYISKTEKLTVLMLQWPMKSEKLRLPGSDPSKRASLLKLLFSCIFEFLLIDMSGKSSVFWRIPLPFYQGNPLSLWKIWWGWRLKSSFSKKWNWVAGDLRWLQGDHLVGHVINA